MKRLLIGSPFVFLTAATALAQDPSTTPEVSGAAFAAVGGVVCVFYLICIALWLWAAIFVMKDAKRRNSPNKTLVTVLTWIPMTWVIGWIIHLVTRPKTVSGSPNP